MPVQNYELLDSNTDVTTTRTLLHEVIPMTGSIYRHNTGAYNDENIKNYTHGMFQSVYDYPYLSSSANHIFDITVGYDRSKRALSESAQYNGVQNTKKNQSRIQPVAQTLLGIKAPPQTVLESLKVIYVLMIQAQIQWTVSLFRFPDFYERPN